MKKAEHRRIDAFAIARHEITITLGEELDAISYLLKEEGKAYFIFPTSREEEFEKESAARGFALVEKTYLTSSEEKAPESFIALLKKGEASEEPSVKTIVTKDSLGKMSVPVAALYRYNRLSPMTLSNCSSTQSRRFTMS